MEVRGEDGEKQPFAEDAIDESKCCLGRGKHV